METIRNRAKNNTLGEYMVGAHYVALVVQKTHDDDFIITCSSAQTNNLSCRASCVLSKYTMIVAT